MPNLRGILRWGHIVAGVYLSVFVFSPLRPDETATIVAQIASVSMAASGIAMWQWPRLTRRRAPISRA